MGFSAINVPGEAETFKKVISGDIIYYVRATGSDANTGLAATGSGDGPFLTVAKAIETVNKFAISPTATVTIDIGACTAFGAGEFRSSSLTINHPNADRIIIQGAEPTTIPIQNIRTYGANDAVTGGYFMEVRLESLPTGTDANPGITAGDILVIEEPNYQASSTHGPIVYENDFQVTKMAVVGNEQGLGNHVGTDTNATQGLTFDPFDATPRKFLACGVHEIAEVRASGTANYALLFVRHTNPYNGFTASTNLRTAFITPQGIKLSSLGDASGSIGTLAQNYNENHLIRYDAGQDGSTGSSGLTSDGKGYEDYTTANKQRSVNLQAKLYRTRLNFDTTDGLVIDENLGQLKNIAILGPAHSSALGYGATFDLNLSENTGIKMKGKQGGGIFINDVAISGFQFGVDLENVGGVSADGLFCSANETGVRSQEKTSFDMQNSIFTGNKDGVLAQGGGNIFLGRCISAANERHGAKVEREGSLVVQNSSLCLNGERGVDIDNGKFFVLSPSAANIAAGATQYGGTTTDFLYTTEGVERFDRSKRDGALIFHNYGEGVYGSQADIILNSAIVSYNGKGITYANLSARNGSRVKSEFSNFWAPGANLSIARSSEQSSVYMHSSNGEFVSSQAGEGINGFSGVRGSSIVATNSISVSNTMDAFFVADGSVLRWTGSTADAGLKTADDEATQVGVRAETSSVAVLEGGGLSGCAVGFSAGNHAHIFETVVSQVAVVSESSTSNNGTVTANSIGIV